MKLSFTLLVLSFQFQSNGVDAAGLCRKASSDDYKCGSARGAAPYWPATTTCGLNECCCTVEDGWDSMATYQRDTCARQDNSVIGCFACSGVEACENLDNAHVGDSSCKGQEACHQWGDPPKERLIIGISSCKGKAACRFVRTQVVGTTIGDNSCNADFVCMDCESGSIVPDGTCNDVNNLDEVGQLETYKDYGYVHDEGYRCRACFVSTFYIFSSFELMMCTNHILIMLSYHTQAELRQDNYAIEVAASFDGMDSHCSSLAQEVKEQVVDSLSSNKRFVHLLTDKDMSKKCRKEYLSNSVGVLRNEGIFDEGCKLTIKMNAKLELLKEDVPEFEASFKEAVVESLPMDIVVDEVMATKMMNCEEDGSRGPGGKSKKGKSAKKSKTGKGDKK